MLFVSKSHKKYVKIKKFSEIVDFICRSVVYQIEEHSWFRDNVKNTKWTVFTNCGIPDLYNILYSVLYVEGVWNSSHQTLVYRDATIVLHIWKYA